MRKHCLSGEVMEVETVEHGLIVFPKYEKEWIKAMKKLGISSNHEFKIHLKQLSRSRENK